MYRLNVPRAVRSRSPSPSRSAGRSASPARTASPARSIHSQYARNAVQAPIIPRYRGDTVEPMKLSAIMDQAIPVVAPTSVQPGMGSPMGAPATVTPMTKTPIGAPTTATPITKTPSAAPRTRSPRTKSPVGAPAVATPATAIGTSTSTPKSPVTTPLTKSPIGAPDMGFAFNPVGSTTRKPRSRTPKAPVAPKSPIQQPIPAHIPMNRTPITPPTAVAAPAALTTPFPLPHFTQPTAVTIPPTSTTPFPLPHFTQPIMTPHIPTPAPGGVTYNPTTGLPIGLPMTGLPAGYTYNPTTGMPMPGSQYTPATTGIPSGGYGGYEYGRSGPESNPLWPWITGTAIGTAIGLGIVSHQDKQKSQAPSMPIITWAPTDAGMGTKSVLIEEEHIEQMQTVVVPMMKRIFDFVFSWVGLGTTFVLLCFVEVLRQKLFGATAGETWTYGSSSDGSSMPIVTFADPIAIETSTGPVHIPPLDLATARVTLDRTAKTYVEQLIQYYEALAVETGRESLSERTKSVD